MRVIIQKKCGSDNLTVNERFMSRETPMSMTMAVVQWYCACDTSRDGVLSVRRITGSTYRNERTVNNGTNVTVHCGMWSDTTT